MVGYNGWAHGLNTSPSTTAASFWSRRGLLHIPISDGFWAFGRVGLEHTDNTTNDVNQPRACRGNGYLFGAGFEYNLVQHSMPCRCPPRPRDLGRLRRATKRAS